MAYKDKADHAAYMRQWRKNHPLNAEQRRRRSARTYANVYLKRGILEKEPCAFCGSENSQMHHPDYSQPLKVIWVCETHHRQFHPTRYS